jgi:hypothetical protein
MATKPNENVIEVPVDLLRDTLGVLSLLMKATAEARKSPVTCESHAKLTVLLEKHGG